MNWDWACSRDSLAIFRWTIYRPRNKSHKQLNVKLLRDTKNRESGDKSVSAGMKIYFQTFSLHTLARFGWG